MRDTEIRTMTATVQCLETAARRAGSEQLTEVNQRHEIVPELVALWRAALVTAKTHIESVSAAMTLQAADVPLRLAWQRSETQELRDELSQESVCTQHWGVHLPR